MPTAEPCYSRPTPAQAQARATQRKAIEEKLLAKGMHPRSLKFRHLVDQKLRLAGCL